MPAENIGDQQRNCIYSPGENSFNAPSNRELQKEMVETFISHKYTHIQQKLHCLFTSLCHSRMLSISLTSFWCSHYLWSLFSLCFVLNSQRVMILWHGLNIQLFKDIMAISYGAFSCFTHSVSF
ncbi:hypothetical protein ATANTOWER_013782 [Ataeniobius toweri]|uniref:Uncharacterized protein n=1 Tax=Ataeniobius toweri TaxID=208326 RepID=A0ABU7BZ03_9TELE|nr:hypothetical protein [Ataeniobius toweri]